MRLRVRLSRIVLTATLFVMLAGAGAARSAADPGGGAHFHVIATFKATVGGFEACGIRVTVSGTAAGTHVGRGTWTHSECIDPFSQAPKAHVVGEGVLVASNGDRLVIDFDALADLPDAGTGEIHPRGTYTIARGTGRFVGATGNGSLVVDGIVGQTETAVLDGTIRVGDAE